MESSLEATTSDKEIADLLEKCNELGLSISDFRALISPGHNEALAVLDPRLILAFDLLESLLESNQAGISVGEIADISRVSVNFLTILLSEDSPRRHRNRTLLEDLRLLVQGEQQDNAACTDALSTENAPSLPSHAEETSCVEGLTVGAKAWPNGDEYEGELAEDQPHGLGTMKYASPKSLHRGSWLKGKRHGHGTTEWPNGACFVGNFIEDKAFGLGTMKHTDGKVCSGLWIANEMQGLFVITQPTGGQYEGLLVNEEYTGQGLLKYPYGRVYSGSWTLGKRHGYGLYTWPNGLRYEGEFRDDKYSEGSIDYANGTTYSGAWGDDRPHGFGRLTYRSDCFEGYFDKGSRVHGRQTGSYGYEVYEGFWKLDKRHGYGTLKLSDSNFTGIFEDGEITFGACTFRKGGSYIGALKGKDMHGFGVRTLPDGRKEVGLWRDGKEVEVSSIR
jgi:hypothetical protein